MPDETPAEVVPIFDGPAGLLIDGLVADEALALQQPDLAHEHLDALNELRRQLGIYPPAP